VTTFSKYGSVTGCGPYIRCRVVFQIKDSVTAKQRMFRRHLNSRAWKIPYRDIKNWLQKFWITVSAKITWGRIRVRWHWKNWKDNYQLLAVLAPKEQYTDILFSSAIVQIDSTVFIFWHIFSPLQNTGHAWTVRQWLSFKNCFLLETCYLLHECPDIVS
jgi:hypothetical protein